MFFGLAPFGVGLFFLEGSMIRSLVLLVLITVSGWADAPRPFVDFAFENLEGKIIESDILRKDKVLVYKIGQLSCPSCTIVLGHMGKMYQEYSKKGVAFLDITLDEDVEALKKHAAEHGVLFDTLMDRDSDLASYFGVSLLPVTVITNRAGTIVNYVVGEMEEDELRKMVDRALMD